MSDREPPVVMTQEEQVRRARALMSDPLLLQAFHEITESAIDTWRRSGNPAQREQQWFMVKAIQELERVLERVLEDDLLLGRREKTLRRMTG